VRVLAIYFGKPLTKPGGCEIYRINMPFYYLGQHNWQYGWVYFSEIYEEFKKNGTQAFWDMAANYDIFVFPRAIAPEPQAMEGIRGIFHILRKLGKRIIYEVDDDITNEHRDFSDQGVLGATQIASWTDAITVSTPFLGELMSSRSKRPSHVLPNCIDPLLWDKPKNYHSEGLVIGLSGSTTHGKDWNVLAHVLPRILETQYDVPVTLRLTGFSPDYLRELPRTEHYPGLDYEVYAEVVRDSDIVLAPVDPMDGFNRYKSPIKVIEGMGATRAVGNSLGGAACIATDNPVYRLAIQHEKTGLLVEQTEEAWFNAIDRLIRDVEFRSSLQLTANKWVWKHHDIQKEWVKWDKAYRKTLERPQHNVKLV